MRRDGFMRRFWRHEDGNATAEFAILVPLLFTIFIATLETGLMMTRWVSLDRASDMMIRSLRLGLFQNPTAASLRTAVCDNTFLIENCEENLVVDIREIDRATFLMPAADAPCVLRQEDIIQPVVTITPGQQNDLMLIRVCVTTDAMFPTSTFAVPIELDAMGGYALSVASVYVNEPS
jgi:Flp pilus assembly protein TadG